jgi:hypothetical protein
VADDHIMDISMAYRELLQNMVDGIVEANGGKFEGIKIKRRVEGSVETTVFYTDTHIMGEIVEKPQCVSFVNMAPRITALEQIIHFGGSQKHLVKNQVGQHGEGLKRAALKFLLAGCQVQVWFPISMYEGTRTEFRHLIFMQDGQLFNLAYKYESVPPFERVPGMCDFHRFQVNVSTYSPTEFVPQFNIYQYMLDEQFICDPTNDSLGTVLFEDKYAHQVYVYHFRVCGYTNLLFGYDFFLRRVGRDRDNLPFDQTCLNVARVWNQLIETDADAAEIFYDRVLMNANIKPNTVEIQLFRIFSRKAVETLYNLYKTREAGTHPIRASDWPLITTGQFNRDCFKVVTEHAANLFDAILPPLSVRLKLFINDFYDRPSALLGPPNVARILEPYQVCTTYDQHGIVKYALKDGVVRLNGYGLTTIEGTVGKPEWNRFWNVVLFNYLPALFTDFDGLPLVSKLSSMVPPLIIPMPAGPTPVGPTRSPTICLVDPTESESVEEFEEYPGPQLYVKKQKVKK